MTNEWRFTIGFLDTVIVHLSASQLDLIILFELPWAFCHFFWLNYNQIKCQIWRRRLQIYFRLSLLSLLPRHKSSVPSPPAGNLQSSSVGIPLAFSFQFPDLPSEWENCKFKNSKYLFTFLYSSRKIFAQKSNPVWSWMSPRTTRRSGPKEEKSCWELWAMD